MAERVPTARTIVLEPELVATESDAAEMTSPPADGLVELPAPRPGLQISWPLRACGFEHARAILRDELVCLGGDQPFLSASDEELEDAQLAVTRRPDGRPHLAIYIAPCYGGDVEVYVDVTCGE